MEAPSEALELLLAEAIAIAGGLRGVVAGAVGLDGQDELAGLVGVLGGEVQAVAANAVLADERYAGALERIAHIELERVELGCLGRRRATAPRGGTAASGYTRRPGVPPNGRRVLIVRALGANACTPSDETAAERAVPPRPQSATFCEELGP
jgi:hypothetical protein